MYTVHAPVKNFIRIFIYLLVIWYNQELVIWIWLENVQRQFPTQILFGTITHELSRCMLHVGVQTLRSKCNILRNVTIVEQIDLFGNFFQFFFLVQVIFWTHVFCCLDFLHPSMNGESDAAGYSSEEDSRYPPQMALTPIPGSPVPPEDSNHSNPTRPPILPRFSFEVHVCFICAEAALVYNALVNFVYDLTQLNMSHDFFLDIVRQSS